MVPERRPLSLSAYFSGLADYTFTSRLGVADPPLVDYIADLLTRFMRSDELYAVRDPQGRPLVHVGAMFAEAEARVGEARREVHRHIGDFTLFWAGFYPEALRAKKSSALLKTDDERFHDYCRYGKRAYFIASTIPSAQEETTEVLARLSHDFDLCVFGLNEIRREWESGEGPGQSLPLFTN